MKRIIVYVVLIIVFTSLGVFGYYNKPVDLPEEAILNKTFYRYNASTGEYETVLISNSKIDYAGTSLDLKGCSSYSYDSNTGIVKMDCSKAFRLIVANEDLIVFNIDNIMAYFYLNKDNSYNKEFTSLYNVSVNNYIEDTISYLRTISKENVTDGYAFILSDKCISIECYLVASNYKTLSKKSVVKFGTVDEELISVYDDNLLTTNKPYVLYMLNGKIDNSKTIEIKGIDLSSIEGVLDD